MAETFSVERRRLMRFLGAKVILTPAAERAVGMIKKTVELAEAHGWFMTRQFENEANPDFHSRTTAREIVDDFAGDRLDFWVTGYGTGGTLKGVGRVLRQGAPGNEDHRLRAGRRAAARIRDRAEAAGRRLAGRAAPEFQASPDAGLDPRLHPEAHRRGGRMKLIDRVLPISGADAIRCSKELAAKEGIFVGITSGGTFAGALKIASEAPKGREHSLHASRHRRALSQHPAVRRRPRRHDRGRTGDLALDAERAARRLKLNRAVYAASIAIAVASPPPMHSEATPRFNAARPQRGDQRHQDARARGADRMAERAGAAVDVDLLVREAEVAHRRHRDDREGFVDLEEVDANPCSSRSCRTAS